MRLDIHFLLNRLISFQYSADDYGWPSVSILYRVSTEGHVSRSGRPGHKILAPEMPTDLRRCQKAFNSLSDREQQIVTVKYMPYEIDGRKAIDRDRARFMGMGFSEFKNKYYNAAKKVKKELKRPG